MNIRRPAIAPRPNAALGPNPANRGGRSGPNFGGSPAAWGASLSSPFTVGGVSNFDTQALQPGFRTPYWIDEIRFSATATYNNVGSSNDRSFTGLAGLLEAKLQTGQYAFSRDFIPLGLHAPRWGRANSGAVASGAAGARRSFMSVRWPLPKPLFMPAGDSLQALLRFRSFPSLTAGTGMTLERVNIGLVGRVAAPGTAAPLVRHVPWLATFRKQGSTTGVVQTNDEFRNPFTKTLYVQRFTMRTFAEISYQVGVSDESFDETPPGLVDSGGSYQGPTTTNLNYCGVQMYDTLGYMIVKDYTPVNDVFDGTRGAWTFGRTLAPREQFDVQLQSFGGSLLTNHDYYTMLGMVGFREES